MTLERSGFFASLIINFPCAINRSYATTDLTFKIEIERTSDTFFRRCTQHFFFFESVRIEKIVKRSSFLDIIIDEEVIHPFLIVSTNFLL